MKIYIYENLILDESINQLNTHFANRDSLWPHLNYLNDVYETFKEFETKDANEADFFFVPLFLTGWQFSNMNPWNVIQDNCKFLGNKPHVIVSTGDIGQRQESPYEMQHEANPNRAYDQKYEWLDDRFLLIVLESLSSLHLQDIAILPYQHDKIDLQNFQRDIFASFCGKMIQQFLPPTHIRGGRLYELRDVEPKFIIGSLAEVSARLGSEVSYRDVMHRSIFTLCPAGYGRWTFRMIEALLCGSIPVVLSNDYIFPFSNRIDWNKYVVVVDEKDLLKTREKLESMSQEKIIEMQTNIAKDRYYFEKQFTLQTMIEKLTEQIDYAAAAIDKMRGPRNMHIICVDVTNKCDLACSNCTRLLKNQDSLWEMTPENFRLALRSLKNYGGVIAMIGGNPCTHSKFEELCQIFREEVPNQYQRGLWTNNYFKHREVIEVTFGALNLNPHNVERANEPLKNLYETMVLRRGFTGGYYTGNSKHAPLLTAIQDLYPDKKEMWEKISRCDINREWSATIIQNNGKLRAYFCEVAASFDLARGTDHGIEVTEDWWVKPIQDFSSQIRRFCPGCGAAAKQSPTLDTDQVDTYTKTNEDLALKSSSMKNRKVVELTGDLSQPERRITQYMTT